MIVANALDEVIVLEVVNGGWLCEEVAVYPYFVVRPRVADHVVLDWQQVGLINILKRLCSGTQFLEGGRVQPDVLFLEHVVAVLNDHFSLNAADCVDLTDRE